MDTRATRTSYYRADHPRAVPDQSGIFTRLSAGGRRMGKAPYKFESISLQRGVRCEPDFLAFNSRQPFDLTRG
jgi:hypothetical protein